MSSMRALKRRYRLWHRYARQTYWNSRVTRPAWMGPNVAMASGHTRAWDRLTAEADHRADLAQRRWDR